MRDLLLTDDVPISDPDHDLEAGLRPAIAPDPIDRLITRAARCADPRGEYAALFFSDDVSDTRRAQAICASCRVRDLCLRQALERREPYGVWGGEFFLDGDIVPVRRGRGRPPKVAVSTEVDEVTGMPVVA